MMRVGHKVPYGREMAVQSEEVGSEGGFSD